MSAKAMAPKDPMHDITSDEKKKGNKAAVATSEKGLKEAPETLGDASKGREGHPAVYHDQDSVSYKASAERMKSGSSYDPHRTEIKRMDEERKRTASVADAFLKGQKANQKTLKTDGKSVTYHGNTIASHEGDHVHVTTAGYGHSPSTRGHVNGILSRLGSPKVSVKKGQLHHGDTPIDSDHVIKIKKPEKATFGESRMPASVIKHKQRIANMTPEEKAKKFAGKSEEQLKSMARRHGYGKDSTEYSKTVKEDKGPCWKGYEMVGMKKKAGKPVPNCVPVKEEKGDRLMPGFGNRKDFDTVAKEIGTGKGGMTIVDKAPKGGESSSQTIYPMSPKSTSRVAPDDVEKKLDTSTRGNPQAERNSDLQEKAPPGAKYERMVKHIKDKFSKDGLSAKEKSIAYATAWKAKNREKGE
jgi:hypothetical protein